MGFDAKAEVAGLIDRGLQFLQREFLRIRITAVSQNSSAGKNLDVIHPVVRQFADDLAHFPGTVGFAIMHVPGELDVRGETAVHSCAAGNGHIGPGHEHARSDDITLVNGVAQSYVGESAIGADVAHRGEARFQHRLGIRNGLQSILSSRLPEDADGVALTISTVGQMSVAINEAGKNGFAGQIDNLCVLGDRQVVSDRCDLFATDKDELVFQNGGRFGIAMSLPALTTVTWAKRSALQTRSISPAENLSFATRFSLCHSERARANEEPMHLDKYIGPSWPQGRSG